MTQNQTIIKLIHPRNTDVDICTEIGRITGLIDVENFYKLFYFLEIESNPRKPKDSKVTKDITDTLETNSQLFHFMSKGILISVTKCVTYERDRFKLSFESNEYATPGLLDGGHNTFAIAKFLLSHVIDDVQMKSIKDWDSLKAAWKNNSNGLKALFEPNKTESNLPSEFNFLIPIEIIYPREIEELDVLEKWGQSHRDITHSRNNNVQLTDSTKDNHQGFYEYLKTSLPPNISDKIEWKTNDGGTIKVSDLVALSLIPLSRLPNEYLEQDISLVKIYNSKQYCVETFRKILEKDGNGLMKGATYKLTNPAIKSALDLVPKLLETYDLLYRDFPDAYNSASGKFGRIDGVRIFDDKGEYANNPKYSKKQFHSKYFDLPCNYQYADGFILPIIVGMIELIEYDSTTETMRFVSDPKDFVKNKLEQVLSRYATVIRFANYDPQKIGKDKGTYQMASDAIRSALQS